MEYALSIEGGEGEPISLPKGKDIQKVEFNIWQNDKGQTDRSDQLFNSITIKGKLRRETKQATSQMLEWSKMTKRDAVYKIVSIQVYQGDELIRDYYLKDMFCSSYKENFDESFDENSAGIFELELKQRNGSIETIKVSTN